MKQHLRKSTTKDGKQRGKQKSATAEQIVISISAVNPEEPKYT